jgi:hypothetical protein
VRDDGSHVVRGAVAGPTGAVGGHVAGEGGSRDGIAGEGGPPDGFLPLAAAHTVLSGSSQASAR